MVFSQIFDLLREQNPRVLNKIIPVEVDYGSYDLSLDLEALNFIQTEVQVT